MLPMPITSSAKKALRASTRKRVFNLRRKNALERAVKDVKKMATGGKKDEALALLPKAYQAIDKAAKRGIIKANTAARQKSRLTALLKK